MIDHKAEREANYNKGKAAFIKKTKALYLSNRIPLDRAKDMVANPENYTKEEAIKTLSSINLLLTYIIKY